MPKLSKRIKSIFWGTIPYYFSRLFCPKSEKSLYFRHFKKHGYTRFPYEYADKYLFFPILIEQDNVRNMPYVLHNAKKLYFPREYTHERIVKLYRALLIEQDPASPHRYVDSPAEFEGKTLLDIGAAEGLITLGAIESLHAAWLFECDKTWIEALQATFEPYKDKVHVIEKYVGGTNGSNTITLDAFLEDNSIENLFLKMDIEGEECNTLRGAERLFSKSKNLDFAICTYHRKNDLSAISSILNAYGCNYSRREGLFYVGHSFRPCLVRGKKA